jgi:hypothetical protein
MALRRLDCLLFCLRQNIRLYGYAGVVALRFLSFALLVLLEVESMLVALGAKITEGRGSRVRIALNGVRAVFHRPHPRKETDKGAIVSMRRFLIEAGIKPC